MTRIFLEELTLQPLNSPVSTYTTRYHDRDPFDLSAPYQRLSVWTVEQKQNLIKSLIIGLPTGSITVAVLGVHVERYLRVIDGKQRIEAIRAFIDGEFPVPAWWWQDRCLAFPDIAEDQETVVWHKDLSESGRRHLENRQLPQLQFESNIRRRPPGPGEDPARGWPVIRLTDEEALQREAELYLLVNFGGVDQTAEDAARAASIAGSMR